MKLMAELLRRVRPPTGSWAPGAGLSGSPVALPASAGTTLPVRERDEVQECHGGPGSEDPTRSRASSPAAVVSRCSPWSCWLRCSPRASGSVRPGPRAFGVILFLRWSRWHWRGEGAVAPVERAVMMLTSGSRCWSRLQPGEPDRRDGGPLDGSQRTATARVEPRYLGHHHSRLFGAYWQLDRGVPRHARTTRGPADWVFPQEGHRPRTCRRRRPTFVDYLPLLGYSPRRLQQHRLAPLTARAKLLMMLQSAISLVTVLVVLPPDQHPRELRPGGPGPEPSSFSVLQLSPATYIVTAEVATERSLASE